MKEVYDTFSEYHDKIDIRKIAGRYHPILPVEKKEDNNRLTNQHVRKSNFASYNLFSKQLEVRNNPLPTEFKGLLELSTRAPLCPCPLVLDTMGGFCAYNCRYCFQIQSTSSLLTAFFDSDDPMQPRYARPESVREALNEMLNDRNVEPYARTNKESDICGSNSDTPSLKKAFAQRIPIRFGTRAENFLPAERGYGVALEALKTIKDFGYPLIINTKSTLPTEGEYFKVISEMPDNVAVQISIIHADDKMAKLIEPGAPSSTKRFKALQTLNECGIRAMPRMEPAMGFINNDCEHLEEYFTKAENAGCEHFLGDPFHNTVHSEEIIKTFYNLGMDFDRMWEVTSEYQLPGSYIFEHVMYHAKLHGLKCGTFNYHSVPYNDHVVCCGTDDIFPNWNKYSMIHALNELVKRKKLSFEEFDKLYYGYELHPGYRERFKRAWNMENPSWDNPEWMEGAYLIDDEPGNYTWGFDEKLLGEGFTKLKRLFGKSDD